MTHLQLLVLTLTGALPTRLVRPRDDRGDVPGWVLVTVMSAAIVAALTTVAREELSALLRRALDQVQ
ncbi:MAG: hypothetical protein ACO1ON_05315 [Nocardioides sp.]